MQLLVFIAATIMVIVGAVGVVLRNKPVHSALSLVLTLFGIAVHFVAMEAHFLAAVQVIVYAGAIVVLILFVIMLLGVDRNEILTEPRGMQRRQVMLGSIVGLVLVAALATAISSRSLSRPMPDAPQGFGSAEFIGGLLFQRYLLPFEITGLLLLVATIGILMLAKRKLP
jgi:NADH-quinone oxidoreductase subunit J